MYSNVKGLLQYAVVLALFPSLTGCVIEDAESSMTPAQSQDKQLDDLATQTLEPTPHVEQWRFQGIIKGAQSYNVATFENARLLKRHVREGQLVKQGDLLIELYSPTLEQRKNKAQAAFKSTQAQFELASREFERKQTLFDRKLVARQIFDQAKSDFDTAKEAMNEAKAALQQAANEFADTAIFAQTDGLISRLYYHQGDFISSGQPVLKFESTAKQRVSFSIPEKLAVSMDVAQQYKITTHSTGDIFDATLVEKSLPTEDDIRLHTVTFELAQLAPHVIGLQAELLYQKPAVAAFKVDYRAIRFSLNNQPYLIQVDEKLKQTPVKILAMTTDSILVAAENISNHPVLLGNDATLPVNLHQF